MIRLPRALPALETLRQEGFDVVEYDLAAWRSLPPRSTVLLLNLMPLKAVTELDLARALAFPDRDVCLLPVKIKGQTYKNTPSEHMQRFYVDVEDVMAATQVGAETRLVVTGAPVEQMPFEDVRYWAQLCSIMDWSARLGLRTLYICWGAQAALYHFHGIPKYTLPEKRFGIFMQDVLDADCPLLAGLAPAFPMPNSRHTEVRSADFPPAGPRIVAAGRESGVGVAWEPERRAAYIVGHLEYEPLTLQKEYLRDSSRHLSIHMPEHYYEADDPSRPVRYQWRDAARRFYRNWLDLPPR